MQIVLKNAAGTVTKSSFQTNEQAHGQIGSFWPVVKDGRQGHFEFVNANSTKVKFVEHGIS